MTTSISSVDPSSAESLKSHLMSTSIKQISKAIDATNAKKQLAAAAAAMAYNRSQAALNDSMSDSDSEDLIRLDLTEESAHASVLDLETVFRGVTYCNTDELVTNWKDWLTWLRNRLHKMEANVDDLPVFQRCQYFESVNSVCRNGSQIAAIHRNISLSHATAIQIRLMAHMKLCKSVTVLTAIMQAMNTLLCYYPGAMQICHRQIEIHVLSKFDTIAGLKNGKVREVYCQLVANVVRLGMTGSQGTSSQRQTNAWANQFRCLIDTAHKSLETLYDGTSHSNCQMSLSTSASCYLSEMSTLQSTETHQLQLRVILLLQALTCMLEMNGGEGGAHYEANVDIDVHAALQLVQCVALSPFSLQRRYTALIGLLPSLHHSTFVFLEALIKSVRLPLAAFSHRIVDNIILSEFRSINHLLSNLEVFAASHIAWNRVQSRLFDVIGAFVKLLGAASQFASISDKVVEFFELSIAPVRLVPPILEESGFDLDSRKGPMKLSKNQARRREKIMKRNEARLRQEAQKDYSKLGGAGDNSGRLGLKLPELVWKVRLINSAMRAFSQILTSMGAQVGVKFYRQIQTTIALFVMRMQQYKVTSLEVQLDFLPYERPQCRVALYQALETCMLVMHPQWPPAVHPAMKVFTSGLQDPDWIISSCCQRALTVLRSLTQPRIPPLEFWSSGTLQDQLLNLQMAARTASAAVAKTKRTIEINAPKDDEIDGNNRSDVGDESETDDLHNIAQELRSGGVSVSTLLRGHMSKTEGENEPSSSSGRFAPGETQVICLDDDDDDRPEVKAAFPEFGLSQVKSFGGSTTTGITSGNNEDVKKSGLITRNNVADDSDNDSIMVLSSDDEDEVVAPKRKDTGDGQIASKTSDTSSSSNSTSPAKRQKLTGTVGSSDGQSAGMDAASMIPSMAEMLADFVPEKR